MKPLIISLFLIQMSLCTLAQQSVRIDTLQIEKNDSLLLEKINAINTGHIIFGKVINGDTVMHIYFHEIIILPPRVFKSNRQRRHYTRLIRYVKKVYPYSLIIQHHLNLIESQLDTIHNPTERKHFIKKQEKILRNEFEGQLVKLTILQGRILLKLVDRQTGKTTYSLLKELKGSFSATFWQSIARIFGDDLKSEYKPDSDDAMIEEIIILIENGQI